MGGAGAGDLGGVLDRLQAGNRVGAEVGHAAGHFHTEFEGDGGGGGIEADAGGAEATAARPSSKALRGWRSASGARAARRSGLTSGEVR